MPNRVMQAKSLKMRRAYLKRRPSGAFDGKAFRALYTKPRANPNLEIIPGSPMVQTWYGVRYQSRREFKYKHILKFPGFELLLFFSELEFFFKKGVQEGNTLMVSISCKYSSERQAMTALEGGMVQWIVNKTLPPPSSSPST